MVANDNVGNLAFSGALGFIASSLLQVGGLICASVCHVSVSSAVAAIPSSRQPCRIANIHRQSSPGGFMSSS